MVGRDPVLPSRYVAWICRAEDLVLAEERTSEADRIKIMEARERQKEKIKKLMGTKKSTESVDTASDDGKEGGTEGREGSAHSHNHLGANYKRSARPISRSHKRKCSPSNNEGIKMSPRKADCVPPSSIT